VAGQACGNCFPGASVICTREDAPGAIPELVFSASLFSFFLRRLLLFWRLLVLWFRQSSAATGVSEKILDRPIASLPPQLRRGVKQFFRTAARTEHARSLPASKWRSRSGRLPSNQRRPLHSAKRRVALAWIAEPTSFSQGYRDHRREASNRHDVFEKSDSRNRLCCSQTHLNFKFRRHSRTSPSAATISPAQCNLDNSIPSHKQARHVAADVQSHQEPTAVRD